jgi:hypothetical protein
LTSFLFMEFRINLYLIHNFRKQSNTQTGRARYFDRALVDLTQLGEFKILKTQQHYISY